jgi:hypothetical protein
MGQDGSRFRFKISGAKEDDAGRKKNIKEEHHGSDIVDVLCLPNTQYATRELWKIETIANIFRYL